MVKFSFRYFVFAHGTYDKCRVRIYLCVESGEKVELSQVLLFINCQLDHHSGNLKPFKEFPSFFSRLLVLNLSLPMSYFKKYGSLVQCGTWFFYSLETRWCSDNQNTSKELTLNFFCTTFMFLILRNLLNFTDAFNLKNGENTDIVEFRTIKLHKVVRHIVGHWWMPIFSFVEALS